MSDNLRVFEFAKEIGMETLALMDKLKDWEIMVKSHMAALNPETQSIIRERLEEESSQKKKTAKKKKVVKKKTATKKTTKAKAKKTAVKKAVTSKTKKVTKKKAAATEGDKSATKRVVRRKAGAAKQAETAEKKLQEVKSSVLKPTVNEEEVALTEELATVVTELETSVVVEETQIEMMAKPEESVEAAPVKEVKRPKNIVGKIDLSKVADFKRRKTESKPSDKPGGNRGGGGATSGGVSRAPGAKFVAPPLEAAANRKEKGRKKLASRADEGPKVDPTAEEQIAFNKADFKKREALFQPRKKKVLLGREALKTQITKPKASKRIVKVDNTMNVSELAQELKIKSGQLVGHLMKEGIMVRQTDMLDFDTIALVCTEFDYEAQNVHQSIEDLVVESKGEVNPEDLMPRTPVVTVMGHVDHGKTSILDSIRKADVAAGEAGGITQHIGAYRVKLSDGNFITFLDTPGHEAFTAMRARGANVTDVAVIVVAADDGVMPQTAEAINHAKAAEVPIIVAVNKMDRPNANPDKIKQQLTEFELVPEEWGGDTVFIPTTAITGEGISQLLEAINLQAEMLELKANPKIPGEGIVIESKMEKGRGVVATLLVQEGTISKGDYVVAGPHYGRVRALINDHGKQLDKIGPSLPAEILGLNGTPSAGDKVDVVNNERAAKEIAERRQHEIDVAKNIVPSSKMSLEDLFSKVQAGDVKELNVVLKTDVAGSGEAIKGLFDKIATSKVKVKVVHDAVGGITESDVLLAGTSNAIIVGFNVRPDGGAQAASKKHGVQIKSYNIIYEIADDIRQAMRGVLDPKIVEEAQGAAEVRELFRVPSIGTIAGCYVLDGKIFRDSLLRLVRDGTIVYEGNVSSLRRFKDSVKEVSKDYECGIGIENFNDLKVGDVIEAFKKVEVEAELED